MNRRLLLKPEYLRSDFLLSDDIWMSKFTKVAVIVEKHSSETIQ